MTDRLLAIVTWQVPLLGVALVQLLVRPDHLHSVLHEFVERVFLVQFAHKFVEQKETTREFDLISGVHRLFEGMGKLGLDPLWDWRRRLFGQILGNLAPHDGLKMIHVIHIYKVLILQFLILQDGRKKQLRISHATAFVHRYATGLIRRLVKP